jgi:hypothetical protein
MSPISHKFSLLSLSLLFSLLITCAQSRRHHHHARSPAGAGNASTSALVARQDDSPLLKIGDQGFTPMATTYGIGDFTGLACSWPDKFRHMVWGAAIPNHFSNGMACGTCVSVEVTGDFPPRQPPGQKTYREWLQRGLDLLLVR